MVSNTHLQLQQGAVKAVNQIQTAHNWLIGLYIVEFEQNGEDRANYGGHLLKNLADRVNQKGLNTTLFQRSRMFYKVYPQLGVAIRNILSSQIYATLLPKFEDKDEERIYATLLPKLQNDDNQSTNYEIPAERLLSSISFAHFTELMKIDDPVKRMYYEMLTIQTGLSVRELRRQIGALSYERVGLSGDMENAIRSIEGKIHPQTVEDAVKDDYFFEFLDIPQKSASLLKETGLETMLLDHLQDFILELGNGFCFEARQKRILIGDEYFFIDMVFYHRILKAHVLIELKVSSFDHAYAAQLHTYLNYYRANMMEPDDNPPIGILLVTNKNDALVQYATAGLSEKIFVSKYKLHLPTEQELKDLILKTIREK